MYTQHEGNRTNGKLLCQLLPIGLCQQGAPKGDSEAGGRTSCLLPVYFLPL